MAFIYHILTEKPWERFLSKGFYRPDSLVKEGFIHFSFIHQVENSANKYYSDTESIIILKVSERLVKDALKLEANKEGEIFPYLYRSLGVEEVEDIILLKKSLESMYSFVE